MPDPTPLRSKEEHMQLLSQADMNVPEILRAHEAKMHAAAERAQHIEQKLERVIDVARGHREHHDSEKMQQLLQHQESKPNSLISLASQTLKKVVRELKDDGRGDIDIVNK